MNKKALSLQAMIGTLLLLAVLVVLILFANSVFVRSYAIADNVECATSIIGHAATLKATGESYESEIYCPTTMHYLKSGNDELIKRHLAETMRVCWGTWGKGELQLFNDDKTYCSICSLTEFSKHKQVSGFSDFLLEETIPNSDTTYAQYLSMFSTEDAPQDIRDQISSTNPPTELDTAEKYATVFVYARGGNNLKEFLEGVDEYTSSLTSDAKLGATKIGIAAGGTLGAGYTALATKGFRLFKFSAYGRGAKIAMIAGSLLSTAGSVAAFIDAQTIERAAVVALVPYNADQLKVLGCEAIEARQTRNQ